MTLNGRRHRPTPSGSDTERETKRLSTQSKSSSEDQAATPPTGYTQSHLSSMRERRGLSPPPSPAREPRPLRDRIRGASPDPSTRTPYKRLSATKSTYEGRSHTETTGKRDVAAAALAALESLRRDPIGTRTRQLVSRQSREQDLEIKSAHGKIHGLQTIPPPRSERYSGTAQESPTRSRVAAISQLSPQRTGTTRTSTARDLTRHPTRWQSEDLSTRVDESEGPLTNGTNAVSPGRRLGHKVGTSESHISPSSWRTLTSDRLRTAGSTRQRNVGEDPFVNGTASSATAMRRTKSTGPPTAEAVDRELPTAQTRSRERVVEGFGPPSAPRTERTPLTSLQKYKERNSFSAGLLPRPGTSMAALHHDNPDYVPPRTAPSRLRTYRSTYTLADREKIATPHTQHEFARISAELAYASPLTMQRSTSGSSTSGHDSHSEHRRLMLEALSMFESHLSRLPPMGQTTTNTIPELFQSAQHLVHSLDMLNGMLKLDTTKALEAQIEAEIADGNEEVDLAELWRSVGADYRESLRISDEVVRSMTDFLLGAGKVLREASTLQGQQQHLRTVSLDEDAPRRSALDASLPTPSARSSEDAKSRVTRRSWEAREQTEQVTRLSSRSREPSRVRAASPVMRGSAASSSEGRSVAGAVGEHTPQTVRNGSQLTHSSSVRRLLSTREQRAAPQLAPISTSLGHQTSSSYQYEPSPTPLTRISRSMVIERPRTSASVLAKPSLATLPSESLLSRHQSITDTSNRRKISSSSNMTIRADPSTFSSVLKPSNATTAVTTATVSAQTSPADIDAPYPYNDESPSERRPARSVVNGTTPGRLPSRSVSTLNGLQQREPGWLHAMLDSPHPDEEEPVTRLAPAAPISGSETRRTLGLRPRTSMEREYNEFGVLENGRNTIGSRRASATASMLSLASRERRKTVTEVFQR
ncbi:uncharacterized protein LAESUDRAFT_155894 [Laetiporus sulphureus 93-53]|uniref:Uncharacterized protein n=1 Tax=Laetiporus sulphureus 93-53 TaxID=1314785 RepID=A0A165HL00_9APHY|nr:uncharacterized protein LAESUDRAFT_155894 [Laetiporus sulphureus 93-53]KZT11867.1 hypothetical protein LAESUDRAFT_155894 [Laetiporus sulphureus 93-53]